MSCNKDYLLESFFNIQEEFNIPIHTWRWLEVKSPPEDREDKPQKILFFLTDRSDTSMKSDHLSD